jgi:hypothetical protein
MVTISPALKVVTEQAETLEELAARIRDAHQLVGVHQRKSLEAAIEVGELLNRAKAKLQHGQWLPWLERLGIPNSTAALYMRFARCRAVLEENPNVRNFDDARRAIAVAEHEEECAAEYAAGMAEQQRERRRGRPRATKKENSTPMALLAQIYLAHLFGVKRRTAVKQQLEEFGLPTDDVDRIRTLERNHEPEIMAFLAAHGFVAGRHPETLHEPILDFDVLMQMESCDDLLDWAKNRK